MMDSHTTTNQSKTRAGQQSRTKVAGGLLTAVTAALLALTACTPAPTGTNTAGTSVTSTANEETAASTTKASPPLPVEAVYKPASADGPAQNVPVPVLPDAAKEFSKEGLIAFAEYWYETLGYAFETGDPEPMMEITATGCPTCEAMKQAVESWHEEGRWIVGGQMIVSSTDTSFDPVEDGSYQVVLLVRQENVKYFRGDKSLAEDKGIKTAVADLLVARYDSAKWTVANVSHLQGSKK